MLIKFTPPILTTDLNLLTKRYKSLTDALGPKNFHVHGCRATVTTYAGAVAPLLVQLVEHAWGGSFSNSPQRSIFRWKQRSHCGVAEPTSFWSDGPLCPRTGPFSVVVG